MVVRRVARPEVVADVAPLSLSVVPEIVYTNKDTCYEDVVYLRDIKAGKKVLFLVPD